MQTSLRARAQGRWQDILTGIGISPKFLVNKHGPCPVCGGRDRFRWDNKEGNGTYFCSNCRAGDGVKLVMAFKGCDYRAAVEEVEKFVGRARMTAGSVEPVMSTKEKLEAIKRKWGTSVAPTTNGPTMRYLHSRGITMAPPKVLRDDTTRPGMVALMQSPLGKGVMAHLTLLTEDGRKAPTDRPRLFMPGVIPRGSAVRLFEQAEELGIAEGVETALSAAMLFDMPVWSALNEACLQTWEPPACVKRVVVFGDADANYVGQAAAYGLARRLSLRPQVKGGPLKVDVQLPPDLGTDWNDILQKKRKQGVDRRPSLVP